MTTNNLIQYEVAPDELVKINDVVAQGKLKTGWLSHSTGSFVTEALVQAEHTLRTYEEVSKPSANALRFMVQQLRGARRIRVGVPLVAKKSSLTMPATMQAHSFGLTYSTVEPLAIEYEHAGLYDSSVDLTHALSTRRLALVVPMSSEFAVETKSLSDFKRSTNDHGAVMVWSINYFEEKKEWEFAPTAAVIPRFQAVDFMRKRMGTLTRADRLVFKLGQMFSKNTNMLAAANNANKEREGPDDSVHSEESTIAKITADVLGDPIHVLFQDMLPELIKQLDGEQLRRISRELSMDACWAALGVMSALACQNACLELNENAMHGAEEPTILGKNCLRIPVDPFHGHVDMDWKGSWQWIQQITKAF